ncbi:MAG: N-acetylglucosamine-6-phosphate deacetylase [Pyrinomonadaceae bacterium]
MSFKNSRVVVGDSVLPVSGISVDSGVIVSIESDESKTDLPKQAFDKLTLVPGFIDVHCHGAVGVDANTADAAGLLKVAEFLAKNGVTAWMPTLVPDSDEDYNRAIDAIDELMELQGGKPVAQAVGVHYEGVFASEAMCGALRSQYFKTYSTHTKNHPVGETPPPLLGKEGSLIDLPRLKKGVHMTTLAPEVDGGIELVKELVADDWVVSIGHTRADAATLDDAFEAGARHMTHFFNAMTGVHHRELGVAGWGLANKDVTFDIIADGVHVASQMLEMACRIKSPDKVSLISDSVAPTGLGDGEYELWGEKITVTNGRTQNERGSIAGSVSTMLDGVKIMRAISFSDVEIAKMASTNPARLLGLDDRGSIEVGKRADIVGFDSDGKIAFTMIGGDMCQ